MFDGCRKTFQADFLRKPRTSQELLIFCRRKLGLEFPADPDPPTPPGEQLGDAGKGKGNGEGNNGKTSPGNSALGCSSSSSPRALRASRDGGGSISISISRSSSARKGRPRICDSTIAVDVARAVLAWGKPFRNVETAWRAASVGQSYSVVPPMPRPLPRVTTFVLCSAREVLKGEPSPFLRPGTVGTPLAVDVTVEDVRWLKDLWDTD